MNVLVLLPLKLGSESQADCALIKCFIQNIQSVKTFQHIPKEAWVQVHNTLAQCLEDCVCDVSSVAPWQKLLSFTPLVLPVLPHQVIK